MSPACEDVRESYSALLDNEVDVEYREVLESHLYECSDCLRALAKFKAVTGLYQELPAPETDQDFVASVCSRLDAPVLPAAAATRTRYFLLGLSLLAAAGVSGALWFWLG